MFDNVVWRLSRTIDNRIFLVKCCLFQTVVHHTLSSMVMLISLVVTQPIITVFPSFVTTGMSSTEIISLHVLATVLGAKAPLVLVKVSVAKYVKNGLSLPKS